jgi:hypothetical protein
MIGILKMNKISVFEIESILEMVDDDKYVLGKCASPKCRTPNRWHLAYSSLDQGGACHINAMAKCPCYSEKCLLKKGKLVCFNCVKCCSYSDKKDENWWVCSYDVLEKCEKCKKRYCSGEMQFYGCGCLNCENSCECD